MALADDTIVQPDLLVAGIADLTQRDLPVAPLLAVEVLSPSTRLIDLNLKRARYEQAGMPVLLGGGARCRVDHRVAAAG